jgi:UDP-N-acetylglucosamine 1-carboxyvinyltransferase
MGPLLARFGRAIVAFPGGDMIGNRPIDFHLRAFSKMGADVTLHNDQLIASVISALKPIRCVLAYPSVGATENILMASVLVPGTTTIVNAALEPEVIDLIAILRAMGSNIDICPPGTIVIHGVESLKSVEYTVMNDRLEAGTLLLAAAITKGSISIPNAPAFAMEVFLERLADMGHGIEVGDAGIGVSLTATDLPKAVSFKTMPYPGFPTDLQPLMMVAQCLADGVSVIDETVYENRLIHVRELQRMGAHITTNGTTATIKGVDTLYGAQVIASDIRAAAALVLAGLAASGQTVMTGVHHLARGYQDLPGKLVGLGASIVVE